jgi:hypothetical protein
MRVHSDRCTATSNFSGQANRLVGAGPVGTDNHHCGNPRFPRTLQDLLPIKIIARVVEVAMAVEYFHPPYAQKPGLFRLSHSTLNERHVSVSDPEMNCSGRSNKSAARHGKARLYAAQAFSTTG